MCRPEVMKAQVKRGEVFCDVNPGFSCSIWVKVLIRSLSTLSVQGVLHSSGRRWYWRKCVDARGQWRKVRIDFKKNVGWQLGEFRPSLRSSVNNVFGKKVLVGFTYTLLCIWVFGGMFLQQTIWQMTKWVLLPLAEFDFLKPWSIALYFASESPNCCNVTHLKIASYFKVSFALQEVALSQNNPNVTLFSWKQLETNEQNHKSAVSTTVYQAALHWVVLLSVCQQMVTVLFTFPFIYLFIIYKT